MNRLICIALGISIGFNILAVYVALIAFCHNSPRQNEVTQNESFYSETAPYGGLR